MIATDYIRSVIVENIQCYESTRDIFSFNSIVLNMMCCVSTKHKINLRHGFDLNHMLYIYYKKQCMIFFRLFTFLKKDILINHMKLWAPFYKTLRSN